MRADSHNERNTHWTYRRDNGDFLYEASRGDFPDIGAPGNRKPNDIPAGVSTCYVCIREYRRRNTAARRREFPALFSTARNS